MTKKQPDKTKTQGEIIHIGIENVHEANNALQRASVKDADIFVIAHGLRHVPLIPDISVQSLCTDGNILRYNPLWIGHLKLYLDAHGNAGPETIQALLAHEIMHIILGHTHNAKGITLSHSSYMHDAILLNILNVACDMEVNAYVTSIFPKAWIKSIPSLPFVGFIRPPETVQTPYTLKDIYLCLLREKAKDYGYSETNAITTKTINEYESILRILIDTNSITKSSKTSKVNDVFSSTANKGLLASHDLFMHKDAQNIKEKSPTQDKISTFITELQRKKSVYVSEHTPSISQKILTVHHIQNMSHEDWEDAINYLDAYVPGSRTREDWSIPSWEEGVISGLTGLPAPRLPTKNIISESCVVIAVDISGSMSDSAVVESLQKTLTYLSTYRMGTRVVLAQCDDRVRDWKEEVVGTPSFQDLFDTAHTILRANTHGETDFTDLFRRIETLDTLPNAVIVFSDMQLGHISKAPPLIAKALTQIPDDGYDAFISENPQYKGNLIEPLCPVMWLYVPDSSHIDIARPPFGNIYVKDRRPDMEQAQDMLQTGISL